MSTLTVRDIISEDSKIPSLNPRCQELHITRTFSHKKFLKILEKCKKLETITLSKSTKERLGESTKQLLKSKKIKLIIRKEQGRPISIKIEKLQKILAEYKDYSYRDLEQKLKIPKSKIHYLIKYSKRKKIKDGKKIIYLK
jgi:hypothetical protein